MTIMWVKMTESDGLWISNEGHFYREPYDAPLRGKTRIQPERYIRSFHLSPKGYARINVRGRVHFVHRLVAKYFVADRADAPQVNHIDGNKLNNRAENLEWTTNQENRDHAVALGLHARGESLPQSKLTNAQVAEIRLLGVTMSQRQIGRLYGVSQQNISKILSGRSRA